MKSIIIYIVLLFLFYCCSGSKKDSSGSHNTSKVTQLFINKLNDKISTIPLSSLVESCSLLQLEDLSEDALFNPLFTTITEKYIGILQDRASYKLFNRSGKFLCNVGSIGQGPGEYFNLYDDIIDEKNELIYLAPFGGNKILVYNISGKFIKTIIMPQYMISPRIFLSENILTVIHIPTTGNEIIMIQVDIITEKVLIEIPIHLSVQGNEDGIYSSLNV